MTEIIGKGDGELGQVGTPGRVYQFLSQDEMDDIVVEKMRAQERDLFSRDVNIANSEHILANLPAGRLDEAKAALGRGEKLTLEQQFAVNMEKFLADETARRDEVQRITDAVAVRLPDSTRADAALQRVVAKEEAARQARG